MKVEIQKTINVGGKLDFILPSFFPKCFSIAIFIILTCTINIIIVKPYALNVKFQHFIIEAHFTLKIKANVQFKLNIHIGAKVEISPRAL
jgi:hypothetical protein